MQEIFGIVVNLVVLAIAALHSFNPKISKGLLERLGDFVITVVCIYIVLALVLGTMWGLAHLGEFFSQVIMWMVEAVFWFMPTMS
jgi:hypothetical protein